MVFYLRGKPTMDYDFMGHRYCFHELRLVCLDLSRNLSLVIIKMLNGFYRYNERTRF